MKNKNLKILSFILTMVFMFSIAFNTVNKAVGENPFENITTEFNQFLTDADNGKDTLNVFRTAGNNRYQTSAYLSKIFSSETMRRGHAPHSPRHAPSLCRAPLTRISADAKTSGLRRPSAPQAQAAFADTAFPHVDSLFLGSRTEP